MCPREASEELCSLLPLPPLGLGSYHENDTPNAGKQCGNQGKRHESCDEDERKVAVSTTATRSIKVTNDVKRSGLLPSAFEKFFHSSAAPLCLKCTLSVAGVGSVPGGEEKTLFMNNSVHAHLVSLARYRHPRLVFSAIAWHFTVAVSEMSCVKRREKFISTQTFIEAAITVKLLASFSDDLARA
jgi:hypothetical protein